MKDENVPFLSEKVKWLFTMGCAYEVEEPLTTLGTIIAWDFYPTNDMLMTTHIQLTIPLHLCVKKEHSISCISGG
jgi:hypothetical protein